MLVADERGNRRAAEWQCWGSTSSWSITSHSRWWHSPVESPSSTLSSRASPPGKAREIMVKVLSDSSAGRGMVSRLGVGKRVKHTNTQFMFAQGVIRDGTVKIGPVRSWRVERLGHRDEVCNETNPGQAARGHEHGVPHAGVPGSRS